MKALGKVVAGNSWKVWEECTVGCVEKLKNKKSNYGYSYFIAPWYIETKKT